MDTSQALARVIDASNLTAPEAESLMRYLMSGESAPVETAALLVALRMKGETVEELTGFARGMRDMATQVPVTRKPVVDTCGTGGDGSGTFNISTAVGFVVSGAGAAVAKHGNRSASSQCGSADVLEALGVNIGLPPDEVGRCVDEIGIGFLFAPNLHSAMRYIAPVRKELKQRTFFNLLGPLTNPAGATRQVVGIFDGDRLEDIARVLSHLGTEHAMVVSGADGLDEISISGPTRIIEVKQGDTKRTEFDPGEAGIRRSAISTLRGGDAQRNAAIIRSVLGGEQGPTRDVVLLNAAAACIIAGIAADWVEGLERATESVDSGAARQKLESLVSMTRRGHSTQR